MNLQSKDNQISNDKRRDKIIEFLKYNQGCSKEELVKGVSDYMSKKTVYKILDSLITEQIVRQDKPKPNSRSHKLFLDSENLTILIPYELKEFHKKFIELVDKIYKITSDINLTDENETFEKIFLLKEQFPEFIFSMLVQSYVLLSIHHWPKQIKNKENLQQIISEVFILLSSIVVSLNQLRSKEKLSNNKLEKDELVFSLADQRNLNTPIDKIIMYYAICQKYGLKEEYERVLDILWRINKDVQYIMFSKLMEYEHTFNFGKDHWQELIIPHILSTVQDVELKEELTTKYLKK